MEEQLRAIIEQANRDLVEAREPELINTLKILIAEAQAKLGDL